MKIYRIISAICLVGLITAVCIVMTFRFLYGAWPWEQDYGITFHIQDQDEKESDRLNIHADQVKTICIKHLDATRCADSVLLWELILNINEPPPN